MIGYRYFITKGFGWRRHHGAALIPVEMPHVPNPFALWRLRLMVMTKLALFARWDEDFDKFDDGEWWHIVKNDTENIDCLSGNTRNKIRRGAKRFTARTADREEILAHGYQVYQEAFKRYDTFERIFSEAEFRQAVAELPDDTEFWVVEEKEGGRMVGFSENLVRNDACFYVTIWFCPLALGKYAGYLLIHEMNKHYLNERKLRYVSDGAKSISHQTGIHDFLVQKFHFRRAYSLLRLVYFPGFGLLVGLLFPFRRILSKRSSSFLRKISILLEQERIRRSCLTGGRL